jgi:hypothetical protein
MEGGVRAARTQDESRHEKISPAQGGAIFRSATGSQFSLDSFPATKIRYLFDLSIYFTAYAVHEAGVLTLHFIVLAV